MSARRGIVDHMFVTREREAAEQTHQRTRQALKKDKLSDRTHGRSQLSTCAFLYHFSHNRNGRNRGNPREGDHLTM